MANATSISMNPHKIVNRMGDTKNVQDDAKNSM